MLLPFLTSWMIPSLPEKSILMRPMEISMRSLRKLSSWTSRPKSTSSEVCSMVTSCEKSYSLRGQTR